MTDMSSNERGAIVRAGRSSPHEIAVLHARQIRNELSFMQGSALAMIEGESFTESWDTSLGEIKAAIIRLQTLMTNMHALKSTAKTLDQARNDVRRVIEDEGL